MSRIINVEMKNHISLMDIARKVHECYKAGASEVRIQMESAKGIDNANTSRFEKMAELQDIRQRYKNFFGVELS